jgi:phosphate transport system substrate-binding protein
VTPISRRAIGLVVLTLFAGLAPAAALEDEFPEYRPGAEVSGNLRMVGSDTMNDLMTLWSEAFLRHHPGRVRAVLEGRGSATGPPALLHGTAAFAPMSRRMTTQERQAFERKNGYAPTEVVVALDLLAVYVNAANPLRSLDLVELDAIYSRDLKRERGAAVETWAALGLDGVWSHRAPRRLGRNRASGTHQYFRENVLLGGAFRDDVEAQVDGVDVLRLVARDRYAIGYGGIGLQREGVRAVPLASAPGARPVPPTQEFAYTGEYPLSRLLFLYLDLEPGTRLDPLRADFLRFVFSREGQGAVTAAGCYPVSVSSAKSTLRSLRIALED